MRSIHINLLLSYGTEIVRSCYQRERKNTEKTERGNFTIPIDLYSEAKWCYHDLSAPLVTVEMA